MPLWLSTDNTVCDISLNKKRSPNSWLPEQGYISMFYKTYEKSYMYLHVVSNISCLTIQQYTVFRPTQAKADEENP